MIDLLFGKYFSNLDQLAVQNDIASGNECFRRIE